MINSLAVLCLATFLTFFSLATSIVLIMLLLLLLLLSSISNFTILDKNTFNIIAPISLPISQLELALEHSTISLNYFINPIQLFDLV